MSDTRLTFWDHLDELRSVVVRILIVTVAFAIVAFCFKETLFSIVLAPKESGFVTYRFFDIITHSVSGETDAGFSVPLINTGLARQFVIHMKVAFMAGLLCASPYVIYQLFRFVSPALYADERSYAYKVVGGGYVMFVIGVLVSYFFIFPLTFRFLGTYQVSGDVANMITLESYIDVLVMLSLAMGIVFEMPVVAWLFARLGFLREDFMKQYRRHAVVLILVAAAIITPTTDIFTLMAVAMPMWILYEGSIWIVRRSQREPVTAEGTC